MIREARPEDAAAIVAAYQWLFAPPGVRPPDWDPALADERLGRLIGAADRTAFVAENDGAIVGICTVALDLESVRYERERPDYRSIQFGWGL